MTSWLTSCLPRTSTTGINTSKANSAANDFWILVCGHLSRSRVAWRLKPQRDWNWKSALCCCGYRAKFEQSFVDRNEDVVGRWLVRPTENPVGWWSKDLRPPVGLLSYVGKPTIFDPIRTRVWSLFQSRLKCLFFRSKNQKLMASVEVWFWSSALEDILFEINRS